MSKNQMIRILIVGIGALGGTIATRAVSAGMPIWLATRTEESARMLRSSGLRVSGIGGTAIAGSVQVAAIQEYPWPGLPGRGEARPYRTLCEEPGCPSRQTLAQAVLVRASTR